jgi:hypothetical protein
MPWKECHVMGERLRFVARLLEGEKMALSAGSLGSRARPATRSSGGTRTAGWRRSPNRRYCYPLTITDFASRYLLTCEALSTTQEKFVFYRVRAHVQGIRPAARDPDR